MRCHGRCLVGVTLKWPNSSREAVRGSWKETISCMPHSIEPPALLEISIGCYVIFCHHPTAPCVSSASSQQGFRIFRSVVEDSRIRAFESHSHSRHSSAHRMKEWAVPNVCDNLPMQCMYMYVYVRMYIYIYMHIHAYLHICSIWYYMCYHVLFIMYHHESISPTTHHHVMLNGDIDGNVMGIYHDLSVSWDIMHYHAVIPGNRRLYG